MKDMFSEERRQKICEKLSQEKRVLVKDLAENYEVSDVTIRKDLEMLEKRGFLSRVHGGAIIVNDSFVDDVELTYKERIHAKEKERIARKANALISEGDTIIIDSGSTTGRLVNFLKFRKGITVITNAVNVAAELSNSKIEVILTGGTMRETSYSLVGTLAEDALRVLTADKLFLGVDGVSLDYGMTTPNLLEARVNQLMVKASAEVILMADSSKFGRRALGVIDKVDVLDIIITDNKIRAEDLEKLKDAKIKVYTV